VEERAGKASFRIQSENPGKNCQASWSESSRKVEKHRASVVGQRLEGEKWATEAGEGPVA